MAVSWTDLQKWDLSHMRAQYDELAAQLNHLGGSQARLEAVRDTILHGWRGPAGEDAYWAARKAAESLDHAKQIMDKLKAAVQSSEPYVQKAKEAQQHAIDLAAQKQFSIDPVTTELHDLSAAPPCTPTNANEVMAYLAQRRQDALEVRNAINEAIRLGEEAEQHADQAICEAVGMEYDPHDSSEKEWQPYPDQLFGPDGKPYGKDIEQNGIGDCTVASTMAAMADGDPESIKRMISYDPRTGNYNVTFTKPDGTKQTVSVTPEELRANIAIGGASRVDGKGGDPNAPFWPAVIETAYAKTMPPTDESKLSGKQKDALESFKTSVAEAGSANPQLAETLYRISQGAYPPTSLSALTGKPVTSYQGASALEHDNVASVQAAIANHQPILLSTNGVPDDDSTHSYPLNHDGIPNSHAMQVEKIEVVNGHVIATVRNPWGENNDEGHENPSAERTIDVTELQQAGGFYEIDVAAK